MTDPSAPGSAPGTPCPAGGTVLRPAVAGRGGEARFNLRKIEAAMACELVGPSAGARKTRPNDLRRSGIVAMTSIHRQPLVSEVSIFPFRAPQSTARVQKQRCMLTPSPRGQE